MEKTKRNVPKLRFPGFTDDWEQRKFKDISNRLCVGFVGTCEKYYTDKQNGIPMYRTGNIKDGILTDDDMKYVTREFHEKNKKSQLRKDDILIARFGENGLGALYLKEEEANCLNCIILHVDCRMSPEYVKQYLGSDAFRKKAMANTVGSTFSILNTTTLGNMDIPYTDIIEQNRIGQFLTNLDNTITLHQRKCDEISEYKKGMLQKMFPKNGETVPEVRFPGFTDDWEQRKVSDVAEIVAGGTPRTGVNSYWEPKEVPWLSSGEVHKKIITYTDDMISQEGLSNSSAKMVKENSVLIALAGQGKTRGTVAINRIPLTTNQSIAAMTFDESIVPEFVFCNLENRYDEIRKMSSGDGSRGGLNKQLVGDIIIPYTSINEQKRIGDFFVNLENLITLHQRKVNELQEFKKGLLQQMFV